MENQINHNFLTQDQRVVLQWFPSHPMVNEAILTKLYPNWLDEFEGTEGIKKVDALLTVFRDFAMYCGEQLRSKMEDVPSRKQIDEEIQKRGGLQAGTAVFVKDWLESMSGVQNEDERNDGNMVVAKHNYELLLPKYQLADSLLSTGIREVAKTEL